MAKSSAPAEQSAATPGRTRRMGVLWLITATLSYLVIAALALMPIGKRSRTDNLVPFVRHLAGIAAWLRGEQRPWALTDMILNSLLFIPIGLVLALGLRALLGPRRFVVPALLLGCGGSLLIEVVQLAIPSRVADSTDLILNCLGVALSVWLVVRRDVPTNAVSS